ncbi:hypothetical protein ACHAW5_007323 [Stephanodiscus triporus]|uniref:BD-FAE-like domain-containing protein n=1 Tax=Stephanodiscus triporus TaxID=2934178 RepID=A0ABD3N8T6_9STRA
MSIPRHVHTTVAPPVPNHPPASTNIDGCIRRSEQRRLLQLTRRRRRSSPPATTTTTTRERDDKPPPSSDVVVVVVVIPPPPPPPRRTFVARSRGLRRPPPARVRRFPLALPGDRIVACYRRGGDCDRRRRSGGRGGDRCPGLRRLDIYGSRSSRSSDGGGKPIVIFLTGGAWIIGHRMWGALVGRALVPFGMLVMVPDYGNYPNADAGGMVRDVDACVQWVFDHAGEHGGDANGIVLVGQSAGAHVGSVVVTTKVLDWLLRARRRGGGGGGEDESTSRRRLGSDYSPCHLRGFVSTSCPHNMVAMRRVFHRRGFGEDLQRRIFGVGHDDDRYGDDDGGDVFERWSPYHLVMKCHEEYGSLLRTGGEKSVGGLALEDVFPKLCVIHGTSDETR